MHRMNWDDLRFFLAVADHGSVASAARQLGVNHSTVLRRVHAFERKKKIRLFERLPAGYVLTAAGEQLVTVVREIADTVSALERRIDGQDLKLEGVIRVTTTDTLLTSVLPPHLASFSQQHPRIEITLALTNSRLNLTKRDADIAIRPAKELPSPLIGERIADVNSAIYGTKAYLDTHTADLISPDHVWLGCDEMLASSPVAAWMGRHIPDEQVAFRADSFVALCEAAKAGLGLVGLPCCLGDAQPELVRLDAQIDNQGLGLWVLTHEDLSRAARIRAFCEHMAKAIAGDRDRLAGKQSS